MTKLPKSRDRQKWEIRVPDASIPGFTENLRWLLDTVPGPDGRMLSTERFAALIAQQGLDVNMSVSYANQLRRGARDNPTAAILAAICRVFAVPQTFFFDPDVNETIKSGITRLSDRQRAALEAIAGQMDSLTPAQLERIESLLMEFKSSGEG